MITYPLLRTSHFSLFKSLHFFVQNTPKYIFGKEHDLALNHFLPCWYINVGCAGHRHYGGHGHAAKGCVGPGARIVLIARGGVCRTCTITNYTFTLSLRIFIFITIHKPVFPLMMIALLPSTLFTAASLTAWGISGQEYQAPEAKLRYLQAAVSPSFKKVPCKTSCTVYCNS